MRVGALSRATAALFLLAACRLESPAESSRAHRAPPPAEPPSGAAERAPSVPVASADARPATPPPASGISHADLMRMQAEILRSMRGEDAGVPEVAPDEHGLPRDEAFTGERPVRVDRARYVITLPDEHSPLATERALRVDDQGDRASVMVVGTGLPVVPGMRITARTGFAGFALTSPEGARYRTSEPDELQRWFAGDAVGAGTALSFRRSGETLVATRGGLALILAGDPNTEPRPLTCRILVSLFLGGDPAATRTGCDGVRLPLRVGLYAREWRAVALERAESAQVELPAQAMAVPPAGATPDLVIPARAQNGAFFAPTELAALPGTHGPGDILTVDNTLTREALVFVDDVAIGWLAPGAHTGFVGLSAGPHAVRGRSLDGPRALARRHLDDPVRGAHRAPAARATVTYGQLAEGSPSSSSAAR